MLLVSYRPPDGFLPLWIEFEITKHRQKNSSFIFEDYTRSLRGKLIFHIIADATQIHFFQNTFFFFLDGSLVRNLYQVKISNYIRMPYVARKKYFNF